MARNETLDIANSPSFRSSFNPQLTCRIQNHRAISIHHMKALFFVLLSIPLITATETNSNSLFLPRNSPSAPSVHALSALDRLKARQVFCPTDCGDGTCCSIGFKCVGARCCLSTVEVCANGKCCGTAEMCCNDVSGGCMLLW
jgi:hypothetical protein